jgi:hypothetical protein
MQEVHQGFDFVRLENISEGGHGSTAIVDLVFDLRFLQALSDGAQIRPKISTAAIDTVAVLTSFLVKERSSGILTVVRGSMDNLSRRLPQNMGKTHDESKQPDSDKHSHR